MNRSRGTLILLLILLVLLLHRGRAVLPQEGPPAFFIETPVLLVSLGEGFPSAGVHQFSDGMLPRGVIEMTGLAGRVHRGAEGGPAAPLQSGEHLYLRLTSGQSLDLTRRWMPAGQRIALGIPLHPDRMSREDWLSLPGIGERLAERIEDDRQLNGDFGSLQTLERVKGIGPKRIAEWKDFF